MARKFWARLGRVLVGLLICAASGTGGVAQDSGESQAPESRAPESRVAANWIWGAPGATKSAPDGQCDFRKTFRVVDPMRGVLHIVCDNRFTVRLNGRLIGMGDDWQRWSSYDVTAALKSGENELVVRCRNEQPGPAGLCVELEVEQRATGREGATVRIVSDASWQAKLQASGTWDPTIEKRTPWGVAHELGRFGATAPWGDAVQRAGELQVVLPSKSIADGPLRLQDGDRVVFLGNTLIERAQQAGFFEAALTAAFPEADVVFRNLGWSGDTVFGHARARFGSVEDGFEHLETHVYAEKPSVIFVAYGANESYAGAEGAESFADGLHRLLDVLSGTGARMVLITPTPLEFLGPPLPDPTPHNEQLMRYRDVIVSVAEERGCDVVDLFGRLKSRAAELGVTGNLTDNGMHLNSLGYWCAAQTLLTELDLAAPPIRVQVDVQSGQADASGAAILQAELSSQRVQFTLQPNSLPIPAPVSAAPSHMAPAHAEPKQPRADTTDAEPAVAWPPRMLSVAHLAPGTYQLLLDGQVLASGSAEQWAAGVSWSHVANQDRAARLLRQIVAKNELYFHRWRPQNETYLFLFRKHEQGNNAVEIPQFDPLIEAAEQPIEQLRGPVAESYELVRQP